MMQWRKLVAALVLSGASVMAMANTVAPDVLVKNTTQEVLTIIKQDKALQAGDKKKVNDLVEAKVLPHFDFTRMTRLAVGKAWRTATPDQQQALVREFRTLLVRTYSKAISTAANTNVDVKPLRMAAGDTETVVRTGIQQTGAQPISVDYVVEKDGDTWKVFDVIVEGASLVTTYRSTFNDEVTKGGIDGLIKSLVQKNQSADAAVAKK